MIVGGESLVAIENVCAVAPGGTTTSGGTDATGELLASEISAPASGAGVGNVTRPVTGTPPATEVRSSDKASWPMVNAADLTTPAALAVTVALAAFVDPTSA